MGCVHIFFNSASFKLIAGLIPSFATGSAPARIVRVKDNLIAPLFASAGHRIPMGAYKLCRIPCVFALASGISLRGRTMRTSAGIPRGSIISIRISPEVIRSKDQSIALLFTGACHRISTRAHKFCLIPDRFSLAGSKCF
jgi:hypothetical protein